MKIITLSKRDGMETWALILTNRFLSFFKITIHDSEKKILFYKKIVIHILFSYKTIKSLLKYPNINSNKSILILVLHNHS